MSSILVVTSSPRGELSHSTTLAQELAQKLAASEPGSTITTRDLVREALPHIDPVFTSGLGSPAEERNAAQAAAVARSDAAVEELFEADTIVIAAGFINFGIPSTLKAWFDHVARAGRTFRYTENGPEGLVLGKKVYLVIASGGIYSSGAGTAFDHAVPYLKSILAFLGMTDVEVIRAEGVALGAEMERDALSKARALIARPEPALQ